MKSFYFQNTYILTNTEKQSNQNIIEFDLTAFLNENNEIYILAWDSEDSLLDWKKNNLNEGSYEKIDLKLFFYSFVIENKANFKWIVLNPEPQINDFNKALDSKATILDLESAYGCWPIFDSVMTVMDDASHYKFYAELYAEQNKAIAPSDFSDTFNSFFNKLIKFKSSYSYDSQYFCEIEGEHFELNNITFFDRDKNEIVKARIDFFGHCFYMIYGAYNLEMNGVFDPDKMLNIDVLTYENEQNIDIAFGLPDCILSIQKNHSGSLDVNPIIFDDPVVLIVRMNQEKLDAIRSFYQQVNKRTKLINDFYNQSTDILFSRILCDGELAFMCKNLVKNSPPEIYIDPDYITILDYLIYDTYKGTVRTSLVSYHLISINVGRDTIKKCSESQVSIRTKASDHLNKLIILSEYICEQKGYSFDIGLFVITTYLLTNFYFVEQASEEWNNRHGFYFSDIHELNIDEVVDIFVSIENINYQSTENIGFFIHFLIKNNLLHEYDNNYLKSFEVLYPKINESLIKKKNNRFIENLKRTESAGSRKYTISDIDLMTGLEFEMFISELFGIMGYISEITKASGDQGIDVIAEKNGVTIGIQAKCYSSAVGNKAVQEAVAGKNHYKLDKVIVITNNTFTESAQKLALSNAVLLWDRSILKEKIEDFF
jgi:hypothetical protein